MFDVSGEALLQIGLAVLFGGALGLEREIRGRAAGLRTMILVCMGSTLIMIVSAQLPAPFHDEQTRQIIRVDPGRIAAGIVTGVGFLGAAVVIKLGDLIRGVTTAATIWLAAGIGIALGQRHYGLATLTVGAALVVLWLFAYGERALPRSAYYRLVVTVQAEHCEAAIAQIRGLLKERALRLMDVTVALDMETSTAEVAFHVRSRRELQAPEVVPRLATLPGIRQARWK